MSYYQESTGCGNSGMNMNTEAMYTNNAQCTQYYHGAFSAKGCYPPSGEAIEMSLREIFNSVENTVCCNLKSMTWEDDA